MSAFDPYEHLPAWRTSSAILALVDVVHHADENGQHFSGFCEACADFYVALNALTIEHTKPEPDEY